MAKQTITAVPTIGSVRLNKKTAVSFTVSVTPPSLPDGVSKWDSIVLTASAVSSNSNADVTINGTTIRVGKSKTAINVTLGTNVTSAPGSYRGTAAGTTGSASGNVTFSDSIISYTYTVPSRNTLYVQLAGRPVEVECVYRKTNGAWVALDDPVELDQNASYVKCN